MDKFLEALKCYAIIIICMLGSIAAIFLLSYVFDLGSITKTPRYIIFGILSLPPTFFIRRWARIIQGDHKTKSKFLRRNSDPRFIVYLFFFMAVLFSSMPLSETAHILRNPMVETLTMKEAVATGKEFVHVNQVEMDTTRHGMSATTREHKHLKKAKQIEYLSFITYRIKGVKNAYWGYKLTTGEIYPDERKAIDRYLELKENTFKDKKIPSGDWHFRRVMPNMPDYDDYRISCSLLEGGPTREPMVYEEMESIEDQHLHHISAAIMLFLFSLFFMTTPFIFAKKVDRKS